MRLPLIRFGGDHRPIELWEKRFFAFVLPVVFVLVLVMSVVAMMVIVVSLLARALLSPILPRSWRLEWDKAFELDPSLRTECPACRVRMQVGPVNLRGHIIRPHGDREVVVPAQTATCPQCLRVFSRYSRGKIWSSWHEMLIDDGEER